MGGLPKASCPSTLRTSSRLTAANLRLKPSARITNPLLISIVFLRERGYEKESGRLLWPDGPVLDTTILGRSFRRYGTAISGRVYRHFGQEFTATSGRVYRHFRQGLRRKYRHFGQGLPPFRAGFPVLKRCFAGSFRGVLLLSAIALVPACLFIAIGEWTGRAVGEVGT